VGETKPYVERGGVGVWIEGDGASVVQSQSEDDTLSGQHQQVIAEVGFRQDHNTIGLIQEARGISQSTFTEVTKPTGEEGEGEVRDWHRAGWGWRDPASFQAGVVEEGGEQGRMRVEKGASDRDGAV
jgi:hypothetical protein